MGQAPPIDGSIEQFDPCPPSRKTGDIPLL